MKLVSVGVVGAHEGSVNMLERRIGGILKDIANVSSFDEKKIPHSKFDIIVAQSYGGRVELLETHYQDVKVIGIDLVLLPVGVKLLMTKLRPGERVGVIADHLRCANHLMSEIIKSGIAHVHFGSGTFDEIENMDMDRFIVAEEMVQRVPHHYVNSSRLLMIPRMVSPHSSAHLIHTVLETASKKGMYSHSSVS